MTDEMEVRDLLIVAAALIDSAEEDLTECGCCINDRADDWIAAAKSWMEKWKPVLAALDD